MHKFFLYTGVQGFFKLLRQKTIFISAIIYFLLSAIILFKYGINVNGEAVKYIGDSQRILHGEHLRNGFFSLFYIVYSAFISFFIYVSVNLKVVACIQVIFSFFAATAIYKLIFDISKNKTISFAAFVFYLLCLPVQKWNYFLYTESLHTSLTVLATYFLYCIFQKEQYNKTAMLLLLLLLIIFSRPVGFIFLMSLIVVSALYLFKKNKKIFAYSSIAVFVVIAALLLQSKFTFYFNSDSLRRMELICQVPQTNSSSYTEYNSAGLSSFFDVIKNEIGIKNFILSGFKKLSLFFGMIRNFYSTVHNIILMLTALVLYPFAIAGLLFKNEIFFYLKTFCCVYVLITSAGIFFTCDEWSNRFMAPVLPQILILAAMGLYFTSSLILKSKIQNKNS